MSKDYYVAINGEKIRVTEDVYHAYMRPFWREQKRNIVRADREKSFDCFEGGIEGFPSNEKLVQEIVEDKILLEMLMEALDALTEDERNIVHALFHQSKTEGEIAAGAGISQQAVSRKKDRIFVKLRKMLQI